MTFAYADKGKKMRLSTELQIGKAAEHLVCADLILQGVSAFLADQGLPYDVVADVDGQLIRIQVKSSLQPITRPKQRVARGYFYTLRRAKRGQRPLRARDYDYIAFVALDVRKVAYIPVSKLMSSDEVHLVQCIWLRAEKATAEEMGFRWKIAPTAMMRCMDDYLTLEVT